MDVHVSKNPAQKAGECISRKLQEHKGEMRLILLSGGTSFDVLDHISADMVDEKTTFMMADERFSEDSAVNNFAQLTTHTFFSEAKARGAQFIESTVDTQNTTKEAAAYAMHKALQYFFKVHPKHYVLAQLGVGTDGHFASVFPQTTDEAFARTYRSTDLYVALDAPQSAAHTKERMCVTPYFLKNHVSDIVLYAVGEEKCNGVLSRLVDSTEHEYELPALIPMRHKSSYLFTDCEKLRTTT